MFGIIYSVGFVPLEKQKDKFRERLYVRRLPDLEKI